MFESGENVHSCRQALWRFPFMFNVLTIRSEQAEEQTLGTRLRWRVLQRRYKQQFSILNIIHTTAFWVQSEVTHTIVSVLLLRFLSTCYWHINNEHSMIKLYLKLQFGGMWHNKWKHTSRETFWSYLWSDCSTLAIQEATEDADKHLHSNTFVIQTKRSAPSREPGH